MSKFKIILGMLLFCFVAASTKAQEDAINKYIYMIRIPATRHHSTIIQTGFRLAGRKGIITSLHGVVDGTTFSADNEHGDVLINLKIVSVDVDKDLALLRSEELEGRPAEGLQAVESIATINPGDNLRSLGHPEGINLYLKDDLKAGAAVQKQLYTMIPPNSARIFDERKSPRANINILNISSGNLGPGFSGAPVLNSSNQVVGIVDGGLRSGTLAISWAIPITEVTWRDISSARTLLNDIAKLETRDLFSFAPDPNPTQQVFIRLKRIKAVHAGEKIHWINGGANWDFKISGENNSEPVLNIPEFKYKPKKVFYPPVMWRSVDACSSGSQNFKLLITGTRTNGGHQIQDNVLIDCNQLGDTDPVFVKDRTSPKDNGYFELIFTLEKH